MPGMKRKPCSAGNGFLVPFALPGTSMLRALPPSALRSYTVTRNPRSASSCAAVRPATPPPSTATDCAARTAVRPAAAAGAAAAVVASAAVPPTAAAPAMKVRRELPTRSIPNPLPTVTVASGAGAYGDPP